jgi:DNA-directed RNA polymerase specialized sigma24 family protein
MPKPFFTPKHKAEIAQMYTESEYTLMEIAAEIGFSEGGVRKLLKRNNVKIRRRGSRSLKRHLSPKEISRTIWLHEQNLFHRQMGMILGISVSAVRSRLAKIRKRCGDPKSRQGCGVEQARNRPSTCDRDREEMENRRWGSQWMISCQHDSEALRIASLWSLCR